MDINKLSRSLSAVIGKTIERVLLVSRAHGRVEMYFCFTDGTHYEFYGDGSLSGARTIDREGVESLRARLAKDAAEADVEIKDIRFATDVSP